MLFAFIVWSALGGAMIGFGIYAVCSKRAAPFGFWANAEMDHVPAYFAGCFVGYGKRGGHYQWVLES